MVKMVKNYPVMVQINKASYADLCNNLRSFRDAQLRRVVTSLDVFVGDVECFEDRRQANSDEMRRHTASHLVLVIHVA